MHLLTHLAHIFIIVIFLVLVSVVLKTMPSLLTIILLGRPAHPRVVVSKCLILAAGIEDLILIRYAGGHIVDPSNDLLTIANQLSLSGAVFLAVRFTWSKNDIGLVEIAVFFVPELHLPIPKVYSIITEVVVLQPMDVLLGKSPLVLVFDKGLRLDWMVKSLFKLRFIGPRGLDIGQVAISMTVGGRFFEDIS
jgi:hypothetical protein